jgi:hypothetical protein
MTLSAGKGPVSEHGRLPLLHQAMTKVALRPQSGRTDARWLPGGSMGPNSGGTLVATTESAAAMR